RKKFQSTTSIQKNVRVDIPVVGDCRLVLEAILREFSSSQTGGIADHAPWLAQIQEWKNSRPLTWKKDDVLKPQQVLEALNGYIKENAIVATEVGQHQMWVSMCCTFREPRTLLTSGGMGTMGYGLPAAIGAQIAFPEKLVVDVAGDGSILMNIQELMTAVEQKLPVKVVILNNGYLGMVRQWQDLFYGRNYVATDISCQPDFVRLAEAFGAEGYRISTEEDLRTILPKALASSAPALIDVRIEREGNVFPMVPGGASLDEMRL
ncbi:MAG: acetolactate synthase large subunit, partial [Desulfovibrionaceae bacterium]|nr:acetolactate synthase large subunit [Desulfovibrionaceae bacterium]